MQLYAVRKFLSRIELGGDAIIVARINRENF